MSRKPLLGDLVEALLRAQPPRAGSLAITIFGDLISQHGNAVWLGSLVEVMERFGLNARQIRTAIFRLRGEGWLGSTQAGRRSYLSYTPFGRRQYERAARRIYATDTPPWDGQWTLITPAGLEAPAREELRKQLAWQGFTTLASGMLAHPRAHTDAVRETLDALDVSSSVVVWRASIEPGASAEMLAGLVHETWRLDDVAARFDDFIDRLAGVLAAVKRERSIDPLVAFMVRTLLIHEYRRVLLKTTELPQDLLPDGWPGQAARQIASAIYRAVHADAVIYAREAMQNRDGALPPVDAGYFERFGGLSPLPVAASAA